jgi:hypothetical protein
VSDWLYSADFLLIWQADLSREKNIMRLYDKFVMRELQKKPK